jgi:hypothetical protein
VLTLLINGQKISTAVLADNIRVGKLYFDPKRSSTNWTVLMKKIVSHVSAFCISRPG